MDGKPTRRDWMIGGGTLAVGAGAALLGASTGRPAHAAETSEDAEPFGYCLNTSTIRGHNLPLSRSVELIAKAGYRGIEPWIRELDDHVKSGKSLKDLGKQLRDLGLSVESAIGFFEWIVDDEERRKKAFDEARRNMEMVREIGGKRLAAPPVGATDRTDLDLNRAGERYRTLLELGKEFGVVPQAEVWGFSKTLGTLAQAVHVAIAADHPDACILPDVYHLHKGGSGFHGIRLLNKDAVHVFHMNDFPAEPPRSRITDADRVYPGDGVGPLGQLFRDLRQIGFRGMLSVELFNREYYQEPVETVLATALSKLRTAVKSGLTG